MTFDRNKPYNTLPLLPPKEDILSKTVLMAAIRASRALGELKVAGRLLPKQEVLIDSLVLLEAKDSSEIENIFTTHDKLYQADLLNEAQIDANTKEVKRYRQALWNGARAMKRKALSTNVFLEIVQTIKRNDAGIRVTPGTKIKNPLGEIIYTPPEGEIVLKDLLSNLETFIHEHDDIDPLIRMAIIHYQFEAIHPFSDGNGRTGRIINILYLLQEGLLETPVLFLSRYIIENKTAYYKGLQNVTEHNDWESWIVYMLNAVEGTALATIDKIDRIKALLIYFSDKVKTEEAKIYRKELIELLFERPYCRIQTVMDRLSVSRKTATSYLTKLETLGLLAMEKVGRENIYINTLLMIELRKYS